MRPTHIGKSCSNENFQTKLQGDLNPYFKTNDIDISLSHTCASPQSAAHRARPAILQFIAAVEGCPAVVLPTVSRLYGRSLLERPTPCSSHFLRRFVSSLVMYFVDICVNQLLCEALLAQRLVQGLGWASPRLAGRPVVLKVGGACSVVSVTYSQFGVRLVYGLLVQPSLLFISSLVCIQFLQASVGLPFPLCIGKTVRSNFYICIGHCYVAMSFSGLLYVTLA